VTSNALRNWYLVHKWSSLVCTLFLLILCVTGLPLIFHDELEDALGYNAPLPEVPVGTQSPALDSIIAAVLASRPGEVVQSVSFDDKRPVVTVGTVKKLTDLDAHYQPVDLRTGKLVAPPPQEEGFLWVMEEMHIRLFAGQPGTYFIGVMGVLFLAAIVSGVVVYTPFMRKVDFGAVRRDRSKQVKWLDTHNLVGIGITAWLTIVGVTGAFNTLDRPLATEFRNGQLRDMMAPYKNAPPLKHLGSLDAAVATALAASPGMEVATIAYPGTFFSTPHHYDVFMRGSSPVTARLLKPTLVDAETAALTDTRDMPLHIRALFISRPLHFGDYGGILLKIVWALLDVACIVVLATGLYLWWGRRRVTLEKRVAEIESGAIEQPAEI
jgi:uncharacterized iron-regulated membrane protein